MEIDMALLRSLAAGALCMTYLCLGAKYFQRAYHMMYHLFCKLHQEVEEGIERSHKYMLERMKKQRRAWC